MELQVPTCVHSDVAESRTTILEMEPKGQAAKEITTLAQEIKECSSYEQKNRRQTKTAAR